MRRLVLFLIALLPAAAAPSLAQGGATVPFSGLHYHSVGDGPSGVAVADLNGDGRLDFVSADHWGHTITAFEGDGDASLEYAGTFETNLYPDAIAAGDLDGDGYAEVATVGEYLSDSVAVFVNRGTGGQIRFEPRVSYPVGDSPSSVTIADLDGDERLDLAVGNRTTADVSILLGNGDGTLQPEARYPLGGWAQALVPGDLDGDGDLDLAAVTSQLTILLNRGDGSFAAPLHFEVGYLPYDLDLADFDGDGVPDVATGNFWNGTVSVLFGNGDGTFQPHVLLDVHPSNLENLVAGDFTGDGRHDIVVSNGFWHGFSLLAGRGDGTFLPQRVFPGGSMQRALEKGDVDGDGDLDLFIGHLAADRVSVVLSRAGAP